MKVEGWVPWDNVENFILTDMEVDPFSEPYYSALKQDVLAHDIRYTGWAHQENEKAGVPIFSDGKAVVCSMRNWGALMAKIWSEVDGKEYNYMDFYM